MNLIKPTKKNGTKQILQIYFKKTFLYFVTIIAKNQNFFRNSFINFFFLFVFKKKIEYSQLYFL